MSLKNELMLANPNQLQVFAETQVINYSSGAVATQSMQSLNDWFAQSFLAPSTGRVNRVSSRVSLGGNPIGYLYAEIRADNAGQPGAVLATSRPMPGEPLSSTHNIDFYFDAGPLLTAATLYWVVFRPGPHTSISAGNRYLFFKAAPGSFGGGSEYASISADGGGTWTNEVANDFQFQVSYAGATTSIVRVLADPAQFSGNGVSTGFFGVASGIIGKVQTTAGPLTFRMVGNGSQVRGNIITASTNRVVEISGHGASFNGSSVDFSSVTIAGPGSSFNGDIFGASTSLSIGSTAYGAVFHGRLTGGSMTMNGVGSAFFGTTSVGGNLGTDAVFAQGSFSSGTLSVNGGGAMARGHMTQVGSEMTSSGNGSLVSGAAALGGKLRATGSGSHVLAHANASNSYTVTASASGSFIQGSFQSNNTATATASGLGSAIVGASGFSGGAANTFTAAGEGDLVGGFANAGTISTGASFGNTVRGRANTGCTITATANASGSLVHAHANDSTTVSNAGQGSVIFGYFNGSGGVINSGTNGSFIMVGVEASGAGGNSAIVTAAAHGSQVFGYLSAGGTINAGAIAAMASGYASGSGVAIAASGQASFARGYGSSGFDITASGDASFAYGRAVNADIIASGINSIAWGNGNNTSGDYASTFGFTNENTSYGCFVIGRFSSVSGFTTGSWVSTEPAFVIGNGGSVGTRSNAFRVLKDGTVNFFGVIDASNSAVSGKGVAVWKKYTVGFAALSAAALTNTITLLSLPSHGLIEHVVIAHSQSFSGGAISAYTVEVGITGNTSKYASPFDVFQAPGAGVGQTSSVADFESIAGATNILITATSVGANLDQANQGSVDIWVKWGTLQ